MYIQDPTLASTFDSAEKEYIKQTESEILAEFKKILDSDKFKADRAVIRAVAVDNFKKFLDDFCLNYREKYLSDNGHAYVEDHPGCRNVFSGTDKTALVDEYRAYLRKLLVK